MLKLCISALLVLVADQLSKIYVLVALDLDNVRSIEVLPPLLSFRMAWNTGVNFGLFANNGEFARIFLIVLALGVAVFLLIYAYRSEATGLVAVSFGLICGGAVGNATDRMIHGAVVDFLNVSCCGFVNPYSFNLADAAICTGAATMIIFAGRLSKTG